MNVRILACAFYLVLLMVPCGSPAWAQMSPEANAARSAILSNVTQDIERLKRDSDAAAASRNNEGASLSERIAEEGKRVAASMRKSYIKTSDGTRIPEFSEGQIQATLDEYNNRAQLAKRSASASAQRITDYGASRSAALQASANGLESQLKVAPSANDSVMLEPTGTNLYVRNYIATPRAEYDRTHPVQPMVATPLSLPRTTAPTLAASHRGVAVETKVSGRLMGAGQKNERRQP